MLYDCVGDVMDVVFSVCIVLVYGECEYFVMQMLYVLCASCGSPQCCVLHDMQLFKYWSRIKEVTDHMEKAYSRADLMTAL